jgi:hypothetical protein
MGSLPYDLNTNRVQCPICHQWVNTYRCGEPFDLIGVGRQECFAGICPVCNVHIEPEICPRNLATCRYNPKP